MATAADTPDDALFDVAAGSRRTPRRVVLIAGASGSGKSSLVRRLGLPAVSLDDFYFDIDHPGLPERFGSVDWDDPRSWNGAAATHALVALCIEGCADVPVYDIPTSRRTGTKAFTASDSRIVLAEGIFASEIVRQLRDEDVLADAICLARGRTSSFWYRLLRDFGESRKPPWTLIRRGFALWRAEPALIRRWVSNGARPRSPAEAERDIRSLAAG